MHFKPMAVQEGTGPHGQIRTTVYAHLQTFEANAKLVEMRSKGQSKRLTLASRLERSALPVGVASVSISLASSFALLRLALPMTIVGLILFGIAILVNSYAIFTKEMKSAQELGFNRTRDAIVYASSTKGLNWQILALAFCALAVTFVRGFGLIGEPSSGGALLSFGAFAYLSAIARLQRKWPGEDQQESNQ